MIKISEASNKKIVAGEGSHEFAINYYNKITREIGVSIHQEIRLIFSDYSSIHKIGEIRELMNKDIPLTGYKSGSLGIDFYTTLTKAEAEELLKK